MIAELGHFALVIALGLALAQVTLSLVGARTGRASWLATSRPLAVGQFVFVAGAFAWAGWSRKAASGRTESRCASP